VSGRAAWFGRIHWTLRLFLAVGITLAIAGGGWAWWLHHRPTPVPEERALFPGIAFARLVRREPRPLAIQVVRIDLLTPGLEFLVTPADYEQRLHLKARTTTQFAREFDAQVAVNGGFFLPWWSHTPWDYYPRVGEPVRALGYAVSGGRAYPEAERDGEHPALYLTRAHRASFRRPKEPVWNAISGDCFLVQGGKPGPRPIRRRDKPEPRTALGLARDGRTLIVMVVDGRQPGYSEGVTLAELAHLFVEQGAEIAINLDGGGSSALVAETTPGRIALLNCPIDNHIPWRERPVANHLGVRVSRRSSP